MRHEPFAGKEKVAPRTDGGEESREKAREEAPSWPNRKTRRTRRTKHGKKTNKETKEKTTRRAAKTTKRKRNFNFAFKRRREKICPASSSCAANMSGVSGGVPPAASSSSSLPAPLCMYSRHLCSRERLNGYDYCQRHILEDR